MSIDHQLKKGARHILQSLEGSGECPMNDFRAPPHDVFAHLADLQVHGSDIKRMGEYIRESWPSVKGIDCSVEINGRIYFDIQIEPYSDADIAKHEAFARWIHENIPGCRSVQMHFYPPLDRNRFRTSTTLYDAGGHSPRRLRDTDNDIRRHEPGSRPAR